MYISISSFDTFSACGCHAIPATALHKLLEHNFSPVYLPQTVQTPPAYLWLTATVSFKFNIAEQLQKKLRIFPITKTNSHSPQPETNHRYALNKMQHDQAYIYDRKRSTLISQYYEIAMIKTELMKWKWVLQLRKDKR